MTPSTVQLSTRYDHHGNRAGYDRLSAYMPDIQVLRGVSVGPLWPIYRRIFRYLVGSRIGHHHPTRQRTPSWNSAPTATPSSTDGPSTITFTVRKISVFSVRPDRHRWLPLFINRPRSTNHGV